MSTIEARQFDRRRFVGLLIMGTVMLSGTAACRMVHGLLVEKPSPSEFGLGPRVSDKGMFVATLNPVEPLRPRKLHTVQFQLRNPEGESIENAVIVIDGGMPQHGHGLPTRPRVTRSLEDGVYEVEGVRFSMGGWWEFTLAVTTPAGNDSVTFNLDI